MEKKTYPSGVITPELGSTNWYSDYDTNSSLLDSNITKTNSLDSKVKELETSYTNVETSLTSLSAVAKSGDYNDLSNKPESIALAEKAVADGDNNVITKTYATKKDVVTSLEPYVKKTELADVATSGSYTDLSYKPTTIAHADRATADNNGDVITVTYAKKTEIPNLDGYALSKDISKVGKTNNYKDLDNLPTIPSLDGYVTNVELSPVAKSGDYNDLSNTPEPVDLTPYATKSELDSKADDDNVVHKSGTETIAGTKTFSSNIVGNVTGNADTATKATRDASGNVITDTYATKTELNSKANDNSVVHRSGDETIAGTKTFSDVTCNGTSYLKMTNLESNTTTPTSARYKHISVVANDGSQVGNIQFCKRADGSFDITIYSSNSSSNDGTLRIASNNEVYPLNNKTKLGISTAKWSEVWANTFNGNLVGNANTATKATQDAAGNVITTTYAKDANVVHKSGAETIVGTKTFKNNIISDVGGSAVIRVEGGSQLFMFKKDYATLPGGIILRSQKADDTYIDFKILNNGSITWNNANILTDANQIMLAKNLSGTKIAPGGAVDCGNGNGKLKQWYLNEAGTFVLASPLPTGVWKSASFVTLAPNEGGIFIKLS